MCKSLWMFSWWSGIPTNWFLIEFVCELFIHSQINIIQWNSRQSGLNFCYVMFLIWKSIAIHLPQNWHSAPHPIYTYNVTRIDARTGISLWRPLRGELQYYAVLCEIHVWLINLERISVALNKDHSAGAGRPGHHPYNVIRINVLRSL